MSPIHPQTFAHSFSIRVDRSIASGLELYCCLTRLPGSTATVITDAQGLSPSETAEGKSPNLTVQSISELGVVTDNYVQEWINAHLEDCIALMSACTLDTVQPMVTLFSLPLLLL